MIELDRRKFFASAGGVAALAAICPEAKADALEDFLAAELDQSVGGETEGAKKYPTAAEIENQIETRKFRRGAGSLFYSAGDNVKKLAPLPAKPTLADMFQLRFMGFSNH